MTTKKRLCNYQSWSDHLYVCILGLSRHLSGQMAARPDTRWLKTTCSFLYSGLRAIFKISDGRQSESGAFPDFKLLITEELSCRFCGRSKWIAMGSCEIASKESLQVKGLFRSEEKYSLQRVSASCRSV